MGNRMLNGATAQSVSPKTNIINFLYKFIVILKTQNDLVDVCTSLKIYI